MPLPVFFPSLLLVRVGTCNTVIKVTTDWTDQQYGKVRNELQHYDYVLMYGEAT